MQFDICNSGGLRPLLDPGMVSFEFSDSLRLVVESILVTIVLSEFIVGVT